MKVFNEKKCIKFVKQNFLIKVKQKLKFLLGTNKKNNVYVLKVKVFNKEQYFKFIKKIQN